MCSERGRFKSRRAWVHTPTPPLAAVWPWASSLSSLCCRMGIIAVLPLCLLGRLIRNRISNRGGISVAQKPPEGLVGLAVPPPRAHDTPGAWTDNPYAHVAATPVAWVVLDRERGFVHTRARTCTYTHTQDIWWRLETLLVVINWGAAPGI